MSLRVGALQWMLAPRELPRDAVIDWMLDEAIRLELDLFNGDPRPMFTWDQLDVDEGHWREVRARADDHGIEIEPYIRSPFDVLESGSGRSAREAVIASIRLAKILGGPVVRTAYGYLWLDKSRFSPAEELAAHMRRLVRVLKEVARIADGEGVRLGIENHVDFTGPQWAHMITEVDSPAIRSGLDTGNALAIFTDPASDVAALAPLALTVQIKDVRVVESGSTDVLGPVPPFRIAGCALGEGVVDIPDAIERVTRHSERGTQTPFHLEISWPQCPPGADARTVARDMLERGVRYLRAYPRVADGGQ